MVKFRHWLHRNSQWPQLAVQLLAKLCQYGSANIFHVSSNNSGAALMSRYQTRKMAGCAFAGNAGNISQPLRVSDSDMPRCMLGSLTSDFLCSWWRGNIPGIPGACATRNFTYHKGGPCKNVVLLVWEFSIKATGTMLVANRAACIASQIYSHWESYKNRNLIMS